MCGIVGLIPLGARGLSLEVLRQEIVAARDTLTHRGPDDEGSWLDERARLALGHRRLAIIDLSAAGAQPMLDESGRYVVVHNGEVYNFERLRKALDSERPLAWRGHSDTEVIVESIARWGVDDAIARFNGMFACAIFDRHTSELHLVRDRAGVKPLYVARARDALVFASEVRAIARLSRFGAELDPEALHLFLRHGYFPAPYTVYRDALQLPPGTVLTVRCEPGAAFDWTALVRAARSRRALPLDARGSGWHLRSYWSAAEAWHRGEQQPFEGSEEDAVARCEELLEDAIAMRMISDVPLGAFLSGGIDSTLVVAMMQRLSTRKVRTFSIGFDDPQRDEAPFARRIAEALGTDHSEHQVTERDCLDVVAELGSLADEPFADSSFIPTYLVCQMGRERVTVAMTGDGGDEVFAGYWKYWRLRHLRLACKLPAAAKALAGRAADALGYSARAGRLGNATYRGSRLLQLLSATDVGQAYTMLSSFPLAAQLVPRHAKPNLYAPLPPQLDLVDPVRLMTYFDFSTHLAGDLLAKVDRASMAVSLECREPLLDYRLVELGASLPAARKIGLAQGKLVLRRLLYRYVDQALVDRPKKGFGVPLARWLRGALEPWAAELLDASSVQRTGLFDAAPIQRRWDEHQSGRANHKNYFWPLLVLLDWLRSHRWSL